MKSDARQHVAQIPEGNSAEAKPIAAAARSGLMLTLRVLQMMLSMIRA